MGLFDKIKNATKSLLNGASASNGGNSKNNTAADNGNPEKKPLEWFASEAGQEAFKIYTSPQNYMLEETLKRDYEKKYPAGDFSLAGFISVYHAKAKVPLQYFEALIDNIKVQPLRFVGPSDFLVKVLEIMAKPFIINDDGEPETSKPILPPEQIVSVEKNPVLYFVKNFNVFDLKDDVLGSFHDKLALYNEILIFLAINAAEIDMAKSQWLFDKNTYINDFGVVKKKKGFLKTCRELSGFTEYFDGQISQLD